MNSKNKIFLTASGFMNALKGNDKRFISMRRFNLVGPFSEHIVFENIEVMEDIFIDEINNHLAPYPIIIENNCLFKNYFIINSGVFKSTFNINGGIFFKGLNISGGIFQEMFSITEGIFKSLFQLGGGIFNSGFYIVSGTYDWIILSGGDYKLWLNINGGTFRNFEIVGKPKIDRSLNIEGGNFHLIKIKLESPISINIQGEGINELLIEYFQVSGLLLKDNILLLKKVVISCIEFQDLINNGQIYLDTVIPNNGFLMLKNSNGYLIMDENHKPIFSETKTKPTLSFFNSDIGKTILINCNLTDFYLNFKNSKINEIFLAGTLLPIDRYINVDDNPKDYEQNRLALNQFKKIFESMGDNVRALEYNAKELNLHLYHLRKLKKYRNIDHSVISSWSERFQLSLNKFSSNHGQNWIKAFFTMLGFSVFFYWIYSISIMGFNLEFSQNGFLEFFRRLAYLPTFVNPIRSYNFLPEQLLKSENVSINAFTIFWDNLSKLVLSYFIYQLIQAFRKHGKK